MPSPKPETTPKGHETLDAGVQTPEELVSFEQYASTVHGGAPPSVPGTEKELSPYDSQSTEGASYLSLSSFEEKIMDMPENGVQLTGDPLIGRFVNNMQILSRLGSGGFGAVYLAEHTELQTPFAIKILNLFQSNRAEVVERFRREARAIALLNHPNIVKIADFGWLDGYGYYLVMEYLEGQSLREVIDEWDLSQGPIPVSRTHELMRQLCGALRLVHHKGIVHRDLKPSNIVLVPGQRVPEVVKLIDFGIASLSDDDSLTASGVCMGSPAYMSPEQADGLSSTLDERSDLYSLGIILYQLLTGELPFIGRGLASYVRMHLMDPPPPLQERCPSVRWHPELEALLQCTLAKDPGARPRDINAFWEQCDQALTVQAEYATTAPIAETHILPSPAATKVSPPPSAETFLFTAQKQQNPHAATLADPRGVVVPFDAGLLEEAAQQSQRPQGAATIADPGGIVIPDDFGAVEQAAQHPKAAVVVSPTPKSGLPWIALLLVVLIVFTGIGIWGLAQVTRGKQAQQQAQQAIQQNPSSRPAAPTSQKVTGRLPQDRLPQDRLPQDRLPQLTKRSAAVPGLPGMTIQKRFHPPIPRPLSAQPGVTPGTRAPPLRPRPIRRSPPRRRTRKRRRRRRYRRRRRRRRYRRRRRRKRRTPKGKTQKRDVFGFNKDPV